MYIVPSLAGLRSIVSEWSETPVLFPVDTFLNVPQTVQPVLFLSSYFSVQPVLRHTMKELCH